MTTVKKKPVVIRTMEDFKKRFYPKSQIRAFGEFGNPQDIARELVKKTFKGVK